MIKKIFSKIYNYVEKNGYFLAGTFNAVNWITLGIVKILQQFLGISSELFSFWWSFALIITMAGYLSILCIPIMLVQQKIIFRCSMEKYINWLLILLSISQLLGYVAFLKIILYKIEYPPVFFSTPSFMFVFLLVKKIFK